LQGLKKENPKNLGFWATSEKTITQLAVLLSSNIKEVKQEVP